MGLQLYIGGSGMGKSYSVYTRIIEESIKNPGVNYIVIVPEQYTMETQRKLVMMHPKHSIMNIDILSFNRLAFRILEEVGANTGKMLDDTGKNLIIRKVCGNCKDELSVFGTGMERIGFISKIKSAISEFMQYGIKAETVMELSKSAKDSLLSAKLKDIAIIYKGFEEYLDKHFLTNERLLEYAGSRVSESRIIKKSVIVFDEFTGFTPVQYSMISQLMCNCRDMIATVIIDAGEKYNVVEGVENLFFLGKDTVSKLYKLADDNRIKVDKPVILDDAGKSRFASNDALYFLQKKLFASNSDRFTRETDSLRIFEASNPRDEIKIVVGEIIRLTRQEDMKYSDIAVVVGDIAEYGDYAAKIFEKNGIPAFIDYKREALGNVAIEFIRSVLNVIYENYSYDSVMRCLKTGFWDMDSRAVDMLDNYCLATGVKGGSAWKKAFARNYRRTKLSVEELEELNTWRKIFAEQIGSLEHGLKISESASDSVEALKAFLSEVGFDEKVKALAKENEDVGLRERAAFYEKLIKSIDELFSQLQELLEGEKLTLREFIKIIDAGFEEIKVGVIPSGMDYVLMGDMERTRINNKKILFCVGVNEGKVPKPASKDGLLNGSDKRKLRELDVVLSPDERETAFNQRLYLYMNFTKPSHRLYISYSLRDFSEKAQSRSYLIGRISKMFPNVQIRLYKEGQLETAIAEDKADIAWEKIDDEIILSVDTANCIYPNGIDASVTRLEEYAECAFEQFAKYGLKLYEREEYEINKGDIGTAIHEIIENVSKKLMLNGKTFADLNEKECEEYANNGVKELQEKLAETAFTDNKRNEFLIERMREISKRTIWALGCQLKNGDFVPFAFEKQINAIMGDRIKYKGKIDRIDICEDGDDLYVKIVDYKSGKQGFDWTLVNEGNQLQLLTYMKVAIDELQKQFPEKNVKPAAALYYRMTDPICNSDKEDEYEQVLLDALKPSGIIACDERIIRHLDNSIQKKSLVIPVTLDKDGNVKITDELLTDKQFESLQKHTYGKLRDESDSILKGNITINPYSYEKETACDYCRYSGVCGFASDIDAGLVRRFKKMSGQQVMDEIMKKEGGSKDNE